MPGLRGVINVVSSLLQEWGQAHLKFPGRLQHLLVRQVLLELLLTLWLCSAHDGHRDGL